MRIGSNGRWVMMMADQFHRLCAGACLGDQLSAPRGMLFRHNEWPAQPAGGSIGPALRHATKESFSQDGDDPVEGRQGVSSEVAAGKFTATPGLNSSRRHDFAQGGARRGYRSLRRQTRRSTIIFLISAIALAGFRPLGQVCAQFMIVWQR